MRFGEHKSREPYELVDGELKKLSSTDATVALDDAIDLYSAPITIADAQTSASVKLEHAYAMLKFNLIGAGSLKQGVRIGAICPTKGFVMESQLNEDGIITPIQECFKSLFTDELEQSEIENLGNMGALICPVDMSGHDVYFYVSHCQTEYDNPFGYEDRDREFAENAYEIVKEGKDLKAGICYTINLDLSTATKLEINKEGELSEPEHFRVLAYCCDGFSERQYKVTDNIDFSNELFFPIYGGRYNTLDGGGHTLKNLTIKDWPLDNVGLFVSAMKTISNLNMENVNISGQSSVGAFMGSGYSGYVGLVNCSLVGENNITGKDYVGGLYGGRKDDNISLSGCKVSQGTTVTGTGENVGGIAGYTHSASACESAATVSGTTCVGGIAGRAKSSVSECTFMGTVTGNDYVGGILGSCYSPMAMYDYSGSAYYCANLGTVEGKNYVGGIIGAANANEFQQSYSTGKVTGQTYVGGISGQGGTINNCYALSDVSGSGDAPEYIAGICGYGVWKMTNCYYAGTVSSGIGIIYENPGGGRINNCITTASSLYSVACAEDDTNAGLETILEKVGVINGDKVYSESETDVWENNPKKCPKFLWQSPALDMGEGSGIKAPAFDTENW